MTKIVKSDFYRRSTLLVASDLLGKYLVRTGDAGRQPIGRLITEVEAYDGPDDLASHASHGRKTARTEVMYNPGGCWYVYLIYGRHQMLNIVTGPANYPAAVLIRSVEGVNGPGRLSRFYNITHAFNRRPAIRSAGLFIEDRGVTIQPNRVKKTPRIGVDYAGPIWSRKKYRFYLAGLVK